jgi:hypothetical protein
MGKKAKRAIPALERLTSHEDPYREMHARHALAFITGDPAPHMARLRAGLKIRTRAAPWPRRPASRSRRSRN